jgi:hypothetical protein
MKAIQNQLSVLVIIAKSFSEPFYAVLYNWYHQRCWCYSSSRFEVGVVGSETAAEIRNIYLSNGRQGSIRPGPYVLGISPVNSVETLH